MREADVATGIAIGARMVSDQLMPVLAEYKFALAVAVARIEQLTDKTPLPSLKK